MTENVYKNYDKTKSKLRQNFEDVKYLIALYIKLLILIKTVSEKVDRLWSTVQTLSTQINTPTQD
jgi:hypothetical protein